METFSRIDEILTSVPYVNENDIAIIHDDDFYTYADLNSGMLGIGGPLQNANIVGDRVIVLLGNRPEAAMAIFAISYTGNAFVPVGTNIKANKLHEIIEDSGATAIITDEKHMKVVNEVIGSLKLVIDVDNLPHFAGIRRQPDAYPGALMYTSGTTGKPKGVICPHQKMINAVYAINDYMMHTRNDLIATALPLSHGYGLYQVFTVLAAGGTVLLENDFRFPKRNLENIKKYNATGFAAVPSMINLIFSQVENWKSYLDELEYLTTAGAGMPPVMFDTLNKGLPSTYVMPMYGQTECVRAIAYFEKDGLDGVKLDSCGIEIPGTKLTLIDVDDDGVGELIVDSNHVMVGYWNNLDDTQKSFVDGRLRTGDLFRTDMHGRFYYVGRDDEVVKIKGERCSPQELDGRVMEMEEVAEAASFAIPDETWGYRMVVFVTPHVQYDTFSKQHVMRYCKDNVENYMMPKNVIIVDAIPKTPNGKISRKMLKEIYEGIGK